MSPFVRVRGHTLYVPPLGPDSFIVDLGANRGGFARQMRERFGGSYYLVEANPVLADELRAEGTFPVRCCAVSARAGKVPFHIAQNDEGSSILTLPESSHCGCVHHRTIEIPSLTLADLFAEAGRSRFDVLKMDIEGAEIEVLENLPGDALRRVGQLTIEFHSAPVFGFDLRAGVAKVEGRLRRLGFAEYDFSRGARSDVLFINRAFHDISRLQTAWWGLRYFPPPWLVAAHRRLPNRCKEWLCKM